jgi:hypothetical protein
MPGAHGDDIRGGEKWIQTVRCNANSLLGRSMCPFLKGPVKRKRFSSGLLRNGSAGRSREFFRLVGRP